MRPKHHNAVAVLRRQLTEYASFSAGPASLVVSLLAILHVLDKGTSFRARPRRCRRKGKERSTMSNARHTAPPSLSPSPLHDSDAVMASLSAVCGSHSTFFRPAMHAQLAVRVPGDKVQGNKQCSCLPCSAARRHYAVSWEHSRRSSPS